LYLRYYSFSHFPKVRFMTIGAAPDLWGARGPGPTTVFMCLAICVTCACHLVIFSKESLCVNAIDCRSARRQYFTWILFDAVTKWLSHLLVSWKSVRYLNLVNVRLSHVERISLRLHSFLVDFASVLLRFAQVACDYIVGLHPSFFLKYMSTFSREMKDSPRTFENVKMSSFWHFIFYMAIISGVTRGLGVWARVENLAKSGQLYRAH